MNAGEPVTDGSEDLFGAAVQLAARVCDTAGPDEIAVSTAVRELCMGKEFRFEDLGVVQLKGMPDGARVYSVLWRA